MLLAVSGTGGIGKTQLASEFAHAHRDDFLGGVFWLNMAQPETVASQVAAAGGPGGLDLPGWGTLDLQARVAAIQRAWNEPVRRLLVLDNLEEPGLLEAWRPTSGGTRVLVTTRRGVWAARSGVRLVTLQTLARPESIRLLLTPHYGDQVESALADPTVAAEAEAICAQVGDLPLALALAGAHLEQAPNLSPAVYRAQLATSLLAHPSLEAELDEALPTRHATSITATIELSYRRLDSAKESDALARTLLHRVAQLAPTPIPQRLLIRITEGDPDDISRADAPLRRLAALGLIERLPDGAIIHRLVAAFVRGAHADFSDSLAACVTALCEEAEQLLQREALTELLPLAPHLFSCVERVDGAIAAPAVQLRNVLGHFLWRYGEGDRARAVLEMAGTRCAGDPELVTSLLYSRVLVNLGLVEQDQGEWERARAYFEQAQAIQEQAFPTSAELLAGTLDNLGTIWSDRGARDRAISLFLRAHQIREEHFGLEHRITADSLTNLAVLAHLEGDYAIARLRYEQAMNIYHAVEGPRSLSYAWVSQNLGEWYAEQGDLRVARRYLITALRIQQRLLKRGHPDIAYSKHHLAALHLSEYQLALVDKTSIAELTRARAHLARSKRLCQEALAVRIASLSPGHADLEASKLLCEQLGITPPSAVPSVDM